MEYLTELLELENEWKGIKISGEEYARTLNENSGLKSRKKAEILAYRDRVMKSILVGDEKELMLKEIRGNLGYLDEKIPTAISPIEPLSKDSQDSQLLTGILIGGLITIFGMYIMDQMKNYLAKGLSDSISSAVYSELQDKGFKSGL